uniref:Transmembrane protein n=1 Tax=Rhipicephalus zambeziensis TaxID=60191 RepID=A0A224YJ99_9ACAR
MRETTFLEGVDFSRSRAGLPAASTSTYLAAFLFAFFFPVPLTMCVCRNCVCIGSVVTGSAFHFSILFCFIWAQKMYVVCSFVFDSEIRFVKVSVCTTFPFRFL